MNPRRSDSPSNDNPEGLPQDNDREHERIDDRSATAKGIDIATRITTMSIMMALPAAIGYYVDLQLGTNPIFIIVGAVFGMASGFWFLLKLVRTLNENE